MHWHLNSIVILEYKISGSILKLNHSHFRYAEKELMLLTQLASHVPSFRTANTVSFSLSRRKIIPRICMNRETGSSSSSSLLLFRIFSSVCFSQINHSQLSDACISSTVGCYPQAQVRC